jgi:signal transduction histidine kinase
MLCQLFVQQNGGQIWVEDNPEGKGSVFSFSVKSGK